MGLEFCPNEPLRLNLIPNNYLQLTSNGFLDLNYS